MKKKTLQKIILKKIETGEVKMKPRWKFEAADKGIKGALVTTLLLTAGAILSVVFFFRDYRPWELIELGEVGRQLIVEDFPYHWLISGTVLVTATVFVLRKVGDNYRKEDREIWIMAIALIVMMSILVGMVSKLL
jgi:hypothetical protein